ncbi:MAG: 3-keto-5-aminohexanoate cleavage protein [Hyphomicrobiales bacterium]|nr:3-keto-5-aminohexanoate cleavage protein [Hyphomicrobiales bacterium]
MNPKTIITCAVTGGDDTGFRFPAVPVTPEQIANACLDARAAGAAIAHIHVRNPETGKASMELDLYRDVVERIRGSGSDVIINLTTGPGARFNPSDDEANTLGPGSNLRTPAERIRHIVALKPEICSLDLGSLNFAGMTLINVQRHVEVMAEEIRKLGVKPELEIFDTGHMALANHLAAKGMFGENPLFQFVLGVPWGAPATSETMALFKNLVPSGGNWAAFGIGRHEFPMLAQALVLGGHVRVGLEDNLYISKGTPAKSNAELVERAAQIVRLLGSEVATPDEARQILKLGTSA